MTSPYITEAAAQTRTEAVCRAERCTPTVALDLVLRIVGPYGTDCDGHKPGTFSWFARLPGRDWLIGSHRGFKTEKDALAHALTWARGHNVTVEPNPCASMGDGL